MLKKDRVIRLAATDVKGLLAHAGPKPPGLLIACDGEEVSMVCPASDTEICFPLVDLDSVVGVLYAVARAPSTGAVN